MKFFENFTWYVFRILVKFDIYFLGLAGETVFGFITDKIISVALEKCKKENYSGTRFLSTEN